LRPQREALARFAAAEDLEIVAEYVEVETGKGSDALDRRPELAAALAECSPAQVPDHRCEAGSSVTRRAFHQRPDGAQGRVLDNVACLRGRTRNRWTTPRSGDRAAVGVARGVWGHVAHQAGKHACAVSVSGSGSGYLEIRTCKLR
jgi:hypothetical protein